MERHVLYANKIHSIVKSESDIDTNHIIKRASISSLSQIAISKTMNEASLAGESIDGFRKVVACENNNTEINLTLQFINGFNLKEHNASQLPSNEKIELCISILKRLSEVHQQQLVHLNLNPQHILIEEETGTIYFISLGLATRIQRRIALQHRLIFSEADHDFIAPEQTGRINADIGYYTDIYSLGVVFYWLFADQLPFEYKEGSAKIHAHIALSPKNPSEIADCPKAISYLIMKMLEKDIQKRYHSAEGVLFDLDYISNELKRHGEVESFELGTNDLSGVLRFSDQLYGRDPHLKKLNETFERTLELEKILLLVFGNSGSGKSVLVEQLYRPVIHRGGFYISGKFDQLKTDVPYFAFSQALGKLVDQILLLNEQDLAHWKTEFHRFLHPIGRVLYDIIPGLDKLLENEPTLPVLNGVEAQLRFNYAISNFFQVLSGSGKPVVIFIDDLQWSDLSSLNLIREVLTNKDINNILIIGAYRDNEITTGHMFLQFKMEIEELGIQPEEIYLDNLKYEDIFRFVTDTLGKSRRPLDELVEIVAKKSGGNPLFVTQFLKAIYTNEMLVFDKANSSWKWDAEKIMGYNVEGDIVNLFLQTINKLPSEAIELLKLASCIGNKFDLGTLSIIRKDRKPAVYQDLKPALDMDLIIESSDGYIYFVHDRVQQAIYSLNEGNEKSEFHLSIGRLLLENTPEQGLREYIFDIVNQFNLSKDLVTDPEESHKLCELNILAGQRSQSATAYKLALQYFENAIQFLPNGASQKDLNFAYNLYFLTAIAANQCNQQDRFDELTNLLDTHATATLDKLKLAELKIQNANVRNDQKKVIDIGLEALQIYNINMKRQPSQIDVLVGYLKISGRLAFYTNEKIENLPRIVNEELIISMSIMHHMSLAAYFIEPNMVPLIMFKLIRLTLKYGLGPKSPFAFVVFGYINIAFMGKMEKGLKMGQLGNKLGEILNYEEQFVSLKQVYVMFISHWLLRLADTIPDLEESLKKGLETGDFEFTSIIGQLIIYWNLYGGEPIDKVLKRGELLSMQVAPLNQIMQIKRIELFRQSVVGLVEGVNNFELLQGEIFDETKIDFPNEPAFGLYFHNLYAQKKLLAIIFNEHEKAWEFSLKEKEYLIPVKGSVTEMLFYFYENLCITPIFASKSSGEQKHLLKICRKNIGLIKGLLKYSEVNYRHRYELMIAEYHSLLNQFDEATKAYTYAIRFARIHKYIQDEAIIWERAAVFFTSQSQPEAAQFYLTNAYKTYAKWGAKAKLLQMKERYAGLISTEEIRENMNSLDLETILKTINLISGEIVLEKILTGLMNLVVENAGAERAFLVTFENGIKVIKASVDVSSNEINVMQYIPYNEFIDISHPVVNYVMRTGETLVLEDASHKTPFSNDDYIMRNEIKSVVCLPLKHAGVDFAYLYLENKLLTGAFTQERIEILQVMATQTAIALQNAMLLDKTTQLNAELIQEVEVRKSVEENLRLNEKRLEEYNANLEFKVNERTLDLQIEKEKSDELLLNILPYDIAKELKEKGTAQAKKYESVSVLFTDFKGFSMIAERLDADELVAEIDYCFKQFDRIIQRHGIEKIKTIGDAYMAVGGLPVTNNTHPTDVIYAALEIRDFVEEHKKKNASLSKPIFEVRIGVHTGNVVAGIVGLRKFAYDIWGDTVNLAARMESSSEPGKINISGVTYELVKDKFNATYRGKIQAKNKGEVDMYFVEGVSNPI
ncbi:MAG TPA: adenylate/guanylate cyclase domain-containing protein [Lunatimonas sp.]|nr:adenylate/guanylate cyclase domain-containing protein [Lunatimonas sp.]